jgi:mannose PTS system EIIA component
MNHINPVNKPHFNQANVADGLINIVIVAHAPLASAYLALVQHVLDHVPEGIYAFDVSADTPPEALVQQLHKLLSTSNTSNTSNIGNALHNPAGLILSDLPGATPHNCAVVVCEWAENRRLISPMNAPMLLRAVNYRNLPLSTLYEKLLSGT